MIKHPIEYFLEHQRGLMHEGYVAMDKDEQWFWYDYRPELGSLMWSNDSCGDCASLAIFAIQPAEDWAKSLYEITQDGWRKVDERES